MTISRSAATGNPARVSKSFQITNLRRLPPNFRPVSLGGEQAEPEIAWARRRVKELAEERKRLARGVGDGSIPGDLAREEHNRIAHELEQAQQTLGAAEMIFDRIEDTLNRALTLVGRCDEVYRSGGPQVRRLSNQFFFEKLLISVHEDGGAQVAGATLNEPWATLVSEDFQAAMVRSATSPRQIKGARGSKNECFGAPSRIRTCAHGSGGRRLDRANLRH
jgi:hypothetical protein